MPKRWHILGILALGILAALIFVLTSPSEPTYNGRPLSDWVILPFNHPDQQPMAMEAVGQIGTNALPYLLDWIRYVQPPAKANYIHAINGALTWLHNTVGLDWSLTDANLQRAEGTPLAFAALGAQAASALPELGRLLKEPELSPTANNRTPDRAAQALANLRELGLSPLLAALTGTNAQARTLAAFAIRQSGTSAIVATPQLIASLTNSDLLTAFIVADTLAELRAKPASFLPMLQACLTNPSLATRENAAWALQRYGRLAAAEVPSVLDFLNETNPVGRSYAREALRKIAPEALTNAPPK